MTRKGWTDIPVYVSSRQTQISNAPTVSGPGHKLLEEVERLWGNHLSGRAVSSEQENIKKSSQEYLTFANQALH